MNDFLALRPIAGMMLVFVVAMLLLGAAVSRGYAALIVPPPEGVAEQFLRALKAHNYGAARDQLSQELAGEVSEEELQVLVRSLETSAGGIEEARGQGSREEGDRATATARVRLGNGREVELEFPLEKEDGLWKITSTEPLRRLPSARALLAPR